MPVKDKNAPLTPSDLRNSTGKGVRVLVLDSGVDVRHPVFSNRQILCHRVDRSPQGGLRVLRDEEGDVFGHGTAVAAILHEYAPGITLESLRVLGGNNSSSSQIILEGLHWAVENRFDILNCSFGSSSPQFLSEYKSAVDRAFCRNVLIVTACNNYDFRKLEYPGAFPTSLSTDFGVLDGLDLRRRPGELVEFVARGEKIRVAWKGGQFRESTGSSFAAPHLAALVARIRELRPTWNACQVKAALYGLSQETGERESGG